MFFFVLMWGLVNILINFEKSYGVKFSKAFVDDASMLFEYLMVICLVYIVYGYDDDVLLLDNFVCWM